MREDIYTNVHARWQAAADARYLLNRFGHRLRIDARTGNPFFGWFTNRRREWHPDTTGEIRWIAIGAILERARQTGLRAWTHPGYVALVVEEAKSKARLLTFDEWRQAA